MADRRSQMGFGQMAQQGPNRGFNTMAGPTSNQFMMMSQQQQMALMQQQQQQQQMVQQGMMPQGTPMIPGANPLMQQQQPNPMMQQMTPMMQQNMMQQQFQQQMFPGQMPQPMPMGMYMMQQGHFVAQGFPPGGTGAGSGQQFTPPPYTTQMAQEFKHKKDKMAVRQAKQLEGQRKRAEAEHKARMFQEQQKRLKEFSAVGGRKMDADSLIKHIIGPDTKGRTGGASQQQTAPEPQENSSEGDDCFGDFITGPTVTDFNQSGASVQQQQFPQVSTNEQAPTISPSAGSLAESKQSEVVTTGQPTVTEEPGPASVQPQTKEEKRDIEKMMFASCDLTAPQKARTFQKRTLVKDAPKKVRAVTYQVSQKSREWKGETESLSELFTLPGGQPSPAAQHPMVAQGQVAEDGQGQSAASQGQAQVSGQTPVAETLPPWCTGEIPIPELYAMVLEATTREGKIQTDLVYPILLRSGLTREVLGAIWGMANRTTPGQLVPAELCAVLAAVALAQNNIALPNLDLLHRLQAPPIPNLGQHVPPDGSTPAPTQPVGSAEGATGQQVLLPGGGVSQSSAGCGAAAADEQEDEFSDFQEAPTGVPPSDSFGEFIIASPVNSTNALPGEPPAPAGKSVPDVMMGEEDKYNVLKTLGQDGSRSVDLFSPSKGNSSVEGVTIAPPGGESMKPTFQRPSQPEVAAFMGHPQPTQPTEFSDFQSAAGEKEFSDFQQAVGTVNLSGSNNQEKLAALKALISDKALYTAKQKEAMSEEAESSKTKDSELWPAFGTQPEENLKKNFDDFTAEIIGRTSDAGLFLSESTPQQNNPGGCALSGQMFRDGGMLPDQPQEEWSGFTSNDQGGENWAKFSHPETGGNEAGNWGQSSMDWAAAPSTEPSKPDDGHAPGVDSTNHEEPKSLFSTKPIKEPPKNNKKLHYFARNLDVRSTGVAAGTGMSPLDFHPPELPDVKDDDEYDDDFDKFGTFRGVDNDMAAGSSNGLSSLGAPFGGLDEYGDMTTGSNNLEVFAYSSRPRPQTQQQKDNTDTVSISSNEFTGWKTSSGRNTKEGDSQSVSSLDLTTIKPPKSSSKDGSPVGGDSQSVSSLEFGAVDRKSATPADERSVASLELKTMSPEDPPPDAMAVTESEDDTFGEFSSATDGPKPGFMAPINKTEYVQCPRKASELLTTGDMPSIGDRYSSLVEKREDADQHVFDWQRCLDHCRAMLEEAASTFTSIRDPNVCEEVLHSQQGTQYIQGVVEIYRVVCRITEAMKAVSVTNPKLVDLLKAIDRAWLDLVTLLSDTALKPTPSQLDFSSAVVKAEEDGAQELACGVCLLNVNARPKRPLGTDDDNHKLTYGGRQYHVSCANFWVNCVDSMLPALKIPELL